MTTIAAEERLRQPESLRERKKLATRRALGFAAMRLAIERGLDNVAVEDIADAAGVSARTFNNYFASKYEAMCSLSMDRGRLVGSALRQRPASEPLLEAITNAVLESYGFADRAPDRDWIEGLRLVIQSPLLQGEYLRTLHAAQQTLAQAIADRLGLDLDADMFPAVLAGAVVSATQVAMERWLHADPPTALIPLITQALGQLRPAGTVTPTVNSLAICCPGADADQGPPRLIASRLPLNPSRRKPL